MIWEYVLETPQVSGSFSRLPDLDFETGSATFLDAEEGSVPCMACSSYCQLS